MSFIYRIFVRTVASVCYSCLPIRKKKPSRNEEFALRGEANEYQKPYGHLGSVAPGGRLCDSRDTTSVPCV